MSKPRYVSPTLTQESQKAALDRYYSLLAEGVGKTRAQETIRSEFGVPERTFRRILKRCRPPERSREDRSHVSETFVLTGWEIRSAVDFRFVRALRSFAKEHDAELLLTPCYLPDLDYLSEDLRRNFDRIVTQDIHFNENLFFKFVETHALLKSPLTGWKGFSQKTAIVNGLVKELVTLPSPNLCKQLMSTGSVGYFDIDRKQFRHIDASSDEEFKRNFEARWSRVSRSQKKTTAIAREFIKPSAVVIEIINEKRFLTRYITQERSGEIHDRGVLYSDRCAPRFVRPAALVVGDSHAWFADRSAVEATFGQIRTLQPLRVVLNDFFDGISGNYHEIRNNAEFDRAPSIREELDITIALLEEFSEACQEVGAELVWCSSNHEDFLLRVLETGDTSLWRVNRNYETWLKLELDRVRRGENRRHPIRDLIPFDRLGITYLDTEENPKIAGVNIRHGHETVSGRRVSFKALAEHFNYLASAHTHSPAVFRNATCAGTTAKLRMPYVSGISGWMHANTLIHEDGSTQLVPIIDGTW